MRNDKLDKIIHEHLMSMDFDAHSDKCTPTERALFFRMKDVAIAYSDQSTSDLLKQVDELRRENERLKYELGLSNINFDHENVLRLSCDSALSNMDNQLSKAKERIAELDGAKWISVNERLPELYKMVMVIDEDNNYIIAEIGGDEERFFESRSPKSPYLSGVTHWMPLPLTQPNK